MNPVVHAEISVHRRGGQIEDYYPLHQFMDCTKTLCSDNRHRILHTLWGVKQVIIPIFGHTLTNSAGKKVNVKDLCEQDHILPDYQNRFIPTLGDFVEAIQAQEDDAIRFQSFFAEYKNDTKIAHLLLSPLSVTGQLQSLLITHNSWFINEILPRIFEYKAPEVRDFDISPVELFSRMSFKPWMDNGAAYPPSATHIKNLKISLKNHD